MDDTELETTRPNENDSLPSEVAPTDVHEEEPMDIHEEEPIQDTPSDAPSNIPAIVVEPAQQLDSSSPPIDSLPQPLPRWMMEPSPKLHVPDKSDYSHLEFKWKVDPASYLTPMGTKDGNPQYNILLDGHSHTYFSDGRMNPEQLLQWSMANGYNAIVVSDHNSIEGALEAQRIANAKYNDSIVVIPGMEYSCCRIHMNFIGIQSNPFGPFNKPHPSNEELKEMIDKVHKMGGLVTVNHIPWSNKTEWLNQVPTLQDHPTREELLEMGVDGFEIINGDVFDFETYVFANNHRTLKISGSDIHHPSDGAYAWTLLNAPNKTFEGIMAALRGKETSFFFDATGTRPRYYPAYNRNYLASLPLISFANAFTFFDDYRGMYSFQGGFCHERKFVVHWLSYFYFVLYCLIFFTLYELARKVVKLAYAKYKMWTYNRRNRLRRLDSNDSGHNREHYTDIDVIDMEP
ncbi:5918_t:CDS:2 [Gigaspora rosea]|nr:5918_t:CDS:2 [Gigaspora rosea]